MQVMKRDGSTEAGVSMEHVRNGGTSALQVSVDPEVPARAKRRRFTAEYKLRVLEEAEASREPGAVAAHTLRFEIIHRAGRLIRPEGRLTLRLQRNKQIENQFTRISEALAKAA